MAEKLTDQQRDAVYNRGGKLLVSAAAGSGKTKVLVERLLSYILDTSDPANIDDFLVITYTKAAASELRAKISKAITQKLSEDPGNFHLQQQFQRLYLAKVSTVHSFCSDILRESAHLLDIPGDFRMIDEKEDKPLRDLVLSEVLKEAYANIADNPDFAAFVDSQGVGRNDKELPELILKVYDSAKCHINSGQWLNDCVDWSIVSSKTDAAETVWGRYLIEGLFLCLDRNIEALIKFADQCVPEAGLPKTEEVFRKIIQQLQEIRACNTWDEIYALREVDFFSLSGDSKSKKKDAELFALAKIVKEMVTSEVRACLADFSQDSTKILEDLKLIEPAVRGLVTIVQKFSEKYDLQKKKMRVMDFSDLEHRALELLMGPDRNTPTAIAKKIGQQFREIMVDEYQDSNGVQDAIFTSLTAERNNLFMVGDVKQSIYQFRLADPGIFLDRYNEYPIAGKEEPGEGRKIVLSNNFRSSEGVIEAVNAVFRACMNPRVGGLYYGDEEALWEGVKKGPLQETAVELHTLNVASSKYDEEAELVAERICQLRDGTHTVREGDGFRPIELDDIVILLRSPNVNGITYVNALQRRGIRTATDRSVNLLETEEVRWLYSFMQTISNPKLDIPLTASMCGPVFGFRADDLALIRKGKKNMPFYEAVCMSDHPAAIAFVGVLNQLRSAAMICSLPELIQQIYLLTRADTIFSAMKDGAAKSSNLQDFYQFIVNYCSASGADLQQTIAYIQQSEEKGLMVSRQNKVKGCVQITSIHKSKGLEYPIVFLCGLSKSINVKDTQKTLLSHKELGFGLSSVDHVERIRYPSLAKRAVCKKMIENIVSESMRLLYVAMTRPVDRLIMMFSERNLEKYLYTLGVKMTYYSKEHVISTAKTMGQWVLYTALQRTESGQLFACGYTPPNVSVSKIPWVVKYHDSVTSAGAANTAEEENISGLDSVAVSKLKETLNYQYPHLPATKAPSKQTPTQRKGRQKDIEVSENAANKFEHIRTWREPSFIRGTLDPSLRGNAYHKAMKYLNTSACVSRSGIDCEIMRLVESGLLSAEEQKLVEAEKLYALFESELGKRLLAATSVLKEYKFSLLDDASSYDNAISDDRVLLQGVVDCAFIEDDGIVILDYKTDYVTDETAYAAVEKYRMQVETYADAMSRIYKLPIKQKLLFFFRIGKAYEL